MGATIASLEIGPAGEGDFVSWQDGDMVTIAYGPQGGAMIAMRIRATGSALADCMAQATWVTGDPMSSELGQSSTPLRWYDDGAGGRTTRTAYVILDREPLLDEPIRVETTVLGVTVARMLVLVP